MKKVILILAVSLVVCVGRTHAIERTWDNGGGNNDWYTTTNWNPDGTPASADALTITNGAPTATGNVSVSGDSGSITIGGGDVTWSGRFNSIGTGPGNGSLLITSGSLTVNYGAGLSHRFNIGNDTTGLLQQQGGTVTAANDNDEIFLGNQAAGNGTYAISGGTLNAGRVYCGTAGTGRFKVIGNAATINLTGSAGTSYSQNSSSTLELDIGAGISPISAGANVTLDGTLDVEFTVTPTVGQTFDIITYGGTLAGTFGTFDTLVESPLGANTVNLSIDYGSGSGDKVVLTVDSVVEPDTTPPTLDPSSFVDDVNGGPILKTALVTYTVTFSEPMNAATVEAGDFENGGTPAATINSVSATGDPSVFEVSVSPGGTGTLQLQVKAGANLEDEAGNPLDTAAAITDDTVISVWQAAQTIVVLENFDSLDPSTDGSGDGSSNLGGQGQLEDIDGSTWSGTDSDTPHLESRVGEGPDRNVQLRAENTLFDRLISSIRFSAQTETNTFSFFYNLEGYDGTLSSHGRLQIGLRNSQTDRNVFGIEIQAASETTLRAHGYQWSGGNADGNQTQIATMPADVTAASVGSIEISYDAVSGNLTVNAYDAPDRGGSILNTASGAVTLGSFSVDSLFIQQTTGNAVGTRVARIFVDDLQIEGMLPTAPAPQAGTVISVM